jgi:Tfp pilus assembly protein PilF
MTQDNRKLSKREKQEISRREAATKTETHHHAKAASVPVLYLMLVFVFGAVLYANTLKNGFVLDDMSVISENFLVKQGSTAIPEIFKTSYRYGYMSVNDGLYRPLSLALFAIEWEMFKGSTMPFHFMNILLYALGGMLLLLYLRRLMPGQPPALPLLATLLFLAHPLHTEVAANVKSADELLCFLFSILVLDLHLRYHQNQKPFYLAGIGIISFLAFLSKESAVLLLVLLPSQALLLNAGGRTFKILPLLPLMAVFLIFLIIRKSVLGSAFGIQSVTMLDNPLFHEDFLTRLLSGSLLMVSYLRQMLFPYPLVFDYSYNSFPVVHADNWMGYTALLAWVSIGLLWLLSLRKKPIVAFFIFFFLATIGFYSNIPFTIGAMRAERFAYFATLPFSIGLAKLILLIPGSGTESGRPMPRGLGLGIFTGILLLFSFLTIQRNADWFNNETLYRADLPKNEDSAKIKYYLGNELTKNKADNTTDSINRKAIIFEGIGYLRESLKIYDKNADAYTQIGVSFYKLKQFDSAAVNFIKALDINPGSNTALNNLGSVYFESKQYEKAVEIYRKVLAIDPNFVDSHVNLGSALGMLQRYPEAATSFQNALALDPQNRKALNFLAITYDLMGKKSEAESARQGLRQLGENP